jgi:hypothetical protein
MPNTSSSAGKEKRLGESRLCGISVTDEDALGMSTGEGRMDTETRVRFHGLCKRGEASGGCGGGSGEATMDAGVTSDEAVTNFSPERRAPSLQDCLWDKEVTT